MPKEMIVSSTSLETRLAILEDGQTTEIFIERRRSKGILGNIYKGKVTRVLPGMQAAFVDIGLDRNAFLYVADVFEDADYEELFEETDQAIEDLLQDEESSGRPAPRRPSRRLRARPKEKGKRVRRPLPPSLEPLALVDTGILPDQISFYEPGNWVRGEVEAGYQGILPAILEVAGAEQTETTGTKKDRQTSIQLDPDILPLAGPRAAARPSSKGRSAENEERRIGDLLKEGQEILVQIAKEPIGRKGARITSHIVLPGRYLVFMPTVDHVGVSRRIPALQERQRLRSLITKLRGELTRGFIVRTAGEGKSEADFRQDMLYLTRVWEGIRTKAEKSSAPQLIHSELDLVQRIIRDFFTDDYKAIRVDEKREHDRIVEFIDNFSPNLVQKVRPYKKKTPIFDQYGISSEIENALRSKVWLKSGGYVVINQTEALVAIDVNTGKYVGKTASLEDTITRTNLDAVKEVVRQLRLRNLGGIIVIDFIDMNEPTNRQKVMDMLRQELAKDKSPSKILQFNEFGLVAITRKRVRQSLERTLCQPCSYCEGSGMTKSERTISVNIHREVRRLLKTMSKGGELLIRCHPEIGKALKGPESTVLSDIRKLTRKEVVVETDPLLHVEKFELIEKLPDSKK